MFEFESAAQRENETVREWTIRLERQVTELNVMAKEAAKEDVMGYNEHRDTAVYESTHKFRLLNVRIDDHAYESFIATLRCQVFSLDVNEVETALITYEQGRDVQRALNSATGSVSAMYPMSAGMGGRKFFCYACNGEGHDWKTCPATDTPEGVARLRSRNIQVPMNLRPQVPTTVGPARHDPNGGRGYGGRSLRPPSGMAKNRYSIYRRYWYRPIYRSISIRFILGIDQANYEAIWRGPGMT
jgi:hypothetical protein